MICHSISATSIFGIYDCFSTPTLTLLLELVVVENASFDVILVVWDLYRDHSELNTRLCVLDMFAVREVLLWRGCTSQIVYLVNMTSDCNSQCASC